MNEIVAHILMEAQIDHTGHESQDKEVTREGVFVSNRIFLPEVYIFFDL